MVENGGGVLTHNHHQYATVYTYICSLYFLYEDATDD